MGVRLLPLNVSELCSHALELERDCEQRFFDYSRHMHEIGAHGVANVFEELGQESINQIRALEVASGDRKPAELSPWEYAWRLTYMPEGMEQKPRLVPLNAREALQLSVLAKRRAQDFFNDRRVEPVIPSPDEPLHDVGRDGDDSLNEAGSRDDSSLPRRGADDVFL